MSNEANKISEAIMEEVEKGTFTPDALRRMEKAISEAQNLEGEVERLKALNEKLSDINADHQEMANEVSERWKATMKREEAVAEREAKIAEIEKKAAVAEAIAKTSTDCFDKVFTSVLFKRSVTSHGSAPAMATDQYGATATAATSHDEEETHTAG